jgi:predicted MFS family arabinose efflux permease
MKPFGESAGASGGGTGAQPWTLYRPGERWLMLFVLFLIGLITMIDRNITAILLEPLKKEFQVSDTMLGLLSGFAFALFYSIMGLPLARFADRHDRKWLIIVSATLWSIFTILCGTAQKFWQLLVFRMGVGGAEAGSIPPSQSLIADYFPPKDRGKAIAIYMAGSGLAFIIALAGGGWIADHYGWRAALLACGIIGFPVVALAMLVLSEPRRRLPGQATIAQTPTEPMRATLAALFRKPAYVYLLIGLTLYFATAQGAVVFIPSFMIRNHGLSITDTGKLVGVAATIASLMSTVFGGVLSDRLARRDAKWLAWVPGICALVALPMFEATVLAQSLWLAIPVYAVAVSATAASFPSLLTAIHAVCGTQRRAFAIAVAMGLSNLVGQSLGPFMTGAISDFFAGAVGSAEGLRRALAVAFLLYLPMGLILLAAGKYMHRDAEA